MITKLEAFSFLKKHQPMPSDNVDIKLVTVTALAQLALNDIKTKDVINVLEDEIERISDEEVKEFVEEVLEDIYGNK